MNAALAEMGFDSHSKKDHAPMAWAYSERSALELILHDHNCLREDKHVRHKLAEAMREYLQGLHE